MPLLAVRPGTPSRDAGAAAGGHEEQVRDDAARRAARCEEPGSASQGKLKWAQYAWALQVTGPARRWRRGPRGTADF
jgi:hypothetical protein